MKRLLFILLLIGGCSKESAVGPAQSPTFVRYFNGGNTDEAQAVLEATDGGLVILANTTIANTTGGTPISKIKLIKTDAFGNQVWEPKFYPPDFAALDVSYAGKGITINPAGGYVIVGEVIKGGKRKLLILTVDDKGDTFHTNTNKETAPERTGYGVTTNAAGNFLVLSQVPNTTTGNMILGEYNHIYNTTNKTFDSVWVRSYGAGTIFNLSNKVFTDPIVSNSPVFWGGTVSKGDVTIRFVKTPTNSQTTEFDLTIGKPGFTEISNDLIRYGTGFAMVGKTNRPITGTTPSPVFNILFKRLSETGTDITPAGHEIFPLTSNATSTITQTDDAEGNSICVAQDGGLVMLSTAKLNQPEGRGETDYVLTKIDAFGNVVWTKSYGSKSADVGKSIITTRDGGHVVLGTTTFANVNSLLLMKTDKFGKIP